MPFRLNTKNVFLTYPRCNALPKALGEHLVALRTVRYACVVREHHADGAYHLHALIQWVDKINIRNQRHFDFEGSHPNIQPARDLQAVHAYIHKAIPENASPDDKWETGEFSSSSKVDKWLRVAEAATEEECLTAALEASPRDFVLQHDKITEYARKKARRTQEYIHNNRITFKLPPQMIAYMANEFRNPVGLLPWTYKEYHSFVDDTGNRIALKPCCSQVPRELEKPLGQEAWAITFTGGECLTSRHFPPKHNISSWTTSPSLSCQTKSSGGVRN